MADQYELPEDPAKRANAIRSALLRMDLGHEHVSDEVRKLLEAHPAPPPTEPGK